VGRDVWPARVVRDLASRDELIRVRTECKFAQGQNSPIMSKIHVFLVQIRLKEAKIL
jgi:hypothetical protein